MMMTELTINMKVMTSDELLAAYAAGERAFRGVDMRGANLEGAYLHDIEMQGSFLMGANFRGAHLQMAAFEDAYLRDADFTGAYLAEASLAGAYLAGTKLEGANLGSAILRGAQFARTNMKGAYVAGARGLYSAYAPFLAAAGDALYAGIEVDHYAKQIELFFDAEDEQGMTAAECRDMVRESWRDISIHAAQYDAAIAFIEACFADDMKFRRWDYLLTYGEALT
jgi:uncharacterized protein YjbI with pentapeptide repeats